MSKATLCLWFDGTAEEAATFYAATFPDTVVGRVQRAPLDYPAGKQGDALVVEMTLLGMSAILLNGGPGHPHGDAFSVQIHTEDQAETDRLWHAIVSNGGRESMCSWCSDRWGISWQIVPRVLMAALAHPDPAASQRAFAAMMTMQKIDIAAIEAAVKG